MMNYQDSSTQISIISKYYTVKSADILGKAFNNKSGIALYLKE